MEVSIQIAKPRLRGTSRCGIASGGTSLQAVPRKLCGALGAKPQLQQRRHECGRPAKGGHLGQQAEPA